MNKTAKKIAIGVSIPLISGIVLLIVGNLIQDIRKKPLETTENIPTSTTTITGDGSINSIGDNNTINFNKNESIINIFPEPQVPPKIDPIEEYLTIYITEDDAGLDSAFCGDVLILLNTIQDRPGYAANITITIKSTGEKEDCNYLDLMSQPRKIGDYKIDVVDIARDHAKFRIIK